MCQKCYLTGGIFVRGINALLNSKLFKNGVRAFISSHPESLCIIDLFSELLFYPKVTSQNHKYIEVSYATQLLAPLCSQKNSNVTLFIIQNHSSKNLSNFWQVLTFYMVCLWQECLFRYLSTHETKRSCVGIFLCQIDFLLKNTCQGPYFIFPTVKL